MKIVTYQYNSNRSLDTYQTVFAELIAQRAAHFPIEFEAADSTVANFLDGWLEGRHDQDPLFHLFESSMGPNGEDLATRYIIDIDGVSSDLKFKLKEYANLPHAEWVFCHSSFLAINYAPSSSRILNLVHESLHLFGVDDCYDELSLQPKSICNNSSCVMRYGQKLVSLEICDSVREQLISFYEQDAHSENIEDPLNLKQQEQQAFFESKSSEWESLLDLVEIDHVGLSDLVNGYVNYPQDFVVGLILRQAGSQITRARSIDLDVGHGLAITQDEREELNEILKQRQEEGELECDADHIATYAFQHERRSCVATFSVPVWNGGYEWELLSVEERQQA